MSLPKWVFKEEETSGVGTGTGLGEVRETSQVRRLKRRARGTEGKPGQRRPGAQEGSVCRRRGAWPCQMLLGDK